MSVKQARILLISVIAVRSTAFLFSKIALRTLEPFNLLGIRFLTAFPVLAVLFHKNMRSSTRRDLLHGAVIGFAFFSVMAFETFALRVTETSTVSFLENSAIVLVPIIESVLRRRMPAKSVMICGALAFTGVGILATRGGGAPGGGEGLCLCAAFMYAVSMILIGRFSSEDDPLLLGIYQIGFMGLFALAASFLTETVRLPSSSVEWSCILILAVVCTCFGFTLQPVAQKYVSTEETARFCAINPLSASVIGWVVLKEPFGLRGVIGAALILLGLLLHGKPEKRDTEGCSHRSEKL